MAHSYSDDFYFAVSRTNLDLRNWLTKYISPAEAENVSEEFVRAGTRLGLAEMIRGAPRPTAICTLRRRDCR